MPEKKVPVSRILPSLIASGAHAFVRLESVHQGAVSNQKLVLFFQDVS